MTSHFFYLLLLVSILKISAQSSIGVHPSIIKWKNIDTENVSVIFPEGQEVEATRIANVITLLNQNYSQSIGSTSKKIDLILQTNQVISNGFVSLAPFRSEFFATPFQNNTILGTTDWLDTLSIHEYRHVQQFLNSKHGLTKIMSYLQGQRGWGLALNLSIPNWYLEGDATIAETIYSQNGRGRTPRFYSEQRALFLDHKDYSYQKARNRSFKDIVPDQYPLGYTIINYTRKLYDHNIWAKIVADAGSYRGIIYPFSAALKKHTGYRAPQLYKKSYSQLKENWLTELDTLAITPTTKISKVVKHTVTNYRNAHYLNDGSIVAVKSSFKKTPHLVHIKGNTETKLTDIGIEPEGFISENNHKIAWTELKTDVRWANRNYTVIKSYDVDTKVKKSITTKGKFFSPHFNSEGTKIVVVESNENLNKSLLILNSTNASIDFKIEIPKNANPSFPKWTKNNSAIVYLLKQNSSVAFFKYDIATSKTTQLTPWTINTIGNYNMSESAIYFNAGHTGIDNIYKVALNGNQRLIQLTSVKVGAYTPDVATDESNIIMSELNSKGNYISTLPISKALQQPINPTPATALKHFQIDLNSKEGNILNNVPNTQYKITDYKGFFKGTKLHSWSLNTNASSTSASLEFDNILSDFSAIIVSGYNFNEKEAILNGSVFYGKYFPILSLQATSQSRSAPQQFVFNQEEVIGTISFNERVIGSGITIPLNWLSGNYRTNLNTTVSYEHRFISNSQLQSNFNLGTISSILQFSNVRRTALQNLAPRWSQVLNISYQRGVTNQSASLFRTLVSFNFPALLPNHSINLEGEFQNENLNNNYQFIDRFQYARGFPALQNDQALRLSANYRLPLGYPDWGFGGITYFKRIKANLFYDYSQAKINLNNSIIKTSSTGVELLFDNTFLNTLPLTFGIRSSYKINNPFNQNRVETQLIFGATF